MIHNVTEEICTNQSSTNIAQVIELCTNYIQDLSTDTLYSTKVCKEYHNGLYINIRAKFLVPQRSSSVTIIPSSCLTTSQVLPSTLMYSTVLFPITSPLSLHSTQRGDFLI